MNGESLDKLFGQFAKGMFILLALYGFGMMIVVLTGKDQLALKLINVWSTMFGAVIGLGSGYLLGRTRSAYDHARKEDADGVRSSE